MGSYHGKCHCGALGFEYTTSIAPANWSVRACQCTFCVKHAGVYTSDPAGSLRFTHADPAQASRYRFGQKTADFIFCGRCGGYLGALAEEDGKALFVLNIHALDPAPEGLPAAQPMSYEGESRSDRDSRRSSRWTPVMG